MTMSTDQEFRSELVRVRRVADMLSTAHANLRDQFKRRALFLDGTILGLSTWLTAVVFVEPRIGVTLTPWHFDPQIWVGLLGVATFFLSILQLLVDWKGRSDAHRRSLDMYAEVKRECGYLLASEQVLTHEKCQRVLARYDMASDVGTAVPERQFLVLKKKHLQKVAISRLLDRQPSASLLLIRMKMWWRDNFHADSN
jgi:hypothetical protein